MTRIIKITWKEGAQYHDFIIYFTVVTTIMLLLYLEL